MSILIAIYHGGISIAGSLFAIETTNLMDFVPVEKVHTAQAVMMMMISLSTLIGVPFAGNLLYDHTKSNNTKYAIH